MNKHRLVCMVVSVAGVLAGGCVDLFGTAGSDLSGCVAFEALGDLWVLSSDPDESGNVIITVSGSGSTIVSVQVQTGSTTCATSGIEENPTTGTVEVDGRRIRLTALVGDTDGNGLPNEPNSCKVELTGTVDACGNATSLFPVFATDVFPVQAQGTATVEGNEYSIGALDLTNVRPPPRIACEDPRDSLEGMNWFLSLRDPFEIPGEGDPLDFNVSGQGQMVDGAGIYGYPPPDDHETPPFECFGLVTAATVFFDGEDFLVHVETEANEKGACVVDAEGRVTSCDVAPGNFIGESATQIVQIDGTVTIRQGELEAQRSPLFLTLSVASEVPGDGNGGGTAPPLEPPPEKRVSP